MNQIRKRRFEGPMGVTACTIRGNPEARNVTLVFGGLHFPRNCDPFFDALSGELGPGHTVVTYDYYGRGDSARPRGHYDESLYMEQADSLWASLGLGGRSVTVIGYSFGGAIATRFAERDPDRVRGLILVGAWMTWSSIPITERGLAAPGVRALLRSSWWKATRHSILEGFVDQEIAPAYADRMLEVEKEIAARDEDGFMNAILDTLYRFPRDGDEVVEAIADHLRPVLLVWGKNDRTAKVEDAILIHHAMPRSQLEWMEGAHNDLWLVPDMAKELRAKMKRFIHQSSMRPTLTSRDFEGLSNEMRPW